LGAPSKDSENGVFFCPPEKLFGEQSFWGGSNFFRGEHQEAESRLRFYRRVGHLGSRQGDRYGLRD